jgi:hypothetical protein
MLTCGIVSGFPGVGAEGAGAAGGVVSTVVALGAALAAPSAPPGDGFAGHPMSAALTMSDAIATAQA